MFKAALLLPLLVVLFVLSGAAGLFYEAVWSRYLSLFVGHGAYAQVITLAVFLGGLGIGALVVSRRSAGFGMDQRVRHGRAVSHARVGRPVLERPRAAELAGMDQRLLVGVSLDAWRPPRPRQRAVRPGPEACTAVSRSRPRYGGHRPGRGRCRSRAGPGSTFGTRPASGSPRRPRLAAGGRPPRGRGVVPGRGRTGRGGPGGIRDADRVLHPVGHGPSPDTAQCPHRANRRTWGWCRA